MRDRVRGNPPDRCENCSRIPCAAAGLRRRSTPAGGERVGLARLEDQPDVDERLHAASDPAGIGQVRETRHRRMPQLLPEFEQRQLTHAAGRIADMHLFIHATTVHRRQELHVKLERVSGQDVGRRKHGDTVVGGVGPAGRAKYEIRGAAPGARNPARQRPPRAGGYRVSKRIRSSDTNRPVPAIAGPPTGPPCSAKAGLTAARASRGRAACSPRRLQRRRTAHQAGPTARSRTSRADQTSSPACRRLWR